MAKEYKIDLRELESKRKEAEDDQFFKGLFEYMKTLKPIDIAEYDIDKEKNELFNYVAGMVVRSLDEKDCNVSASIGQRGFVGTISIECKHLVPNNPLLLKGAMLASDSIEMEADLEGNIVINLTFFNMLKKVSDRSKN